MQRAISISTFLILGWMGTLGHCSPTQKKVAPVQPEGPAYLGILYTDTLRGSLVRQVFQNSPAAKAGLQAGDWITEAGQYRAGGLMSLQQTIASMRPGDELRLVYMRGKAMHSKVAVLESAPADLHSRSYPRQIVPRYKSPYQMPRSIYGR